MSKYFLKKKWKAFFLQDQVILWDAEEEYLVRVTLSNYKIIESVIGENEGRPLKEVIRIAKECR
jgi:hypothetical protein